MIFDVITIFPDMISPVFSFGILKKAIDKGLVRINIHDLRDFTTDAHKTVDDRPYGGGDGMVLKPEPIFRAVESIVGRSHEDEPKRSVILLSPQGRVFDQKQAVRLAELERLVLICGRYEGVDQRVIDFLVDEQISIGDYILSGGEIPAMVVIDAVARLLPNVLGGGSSAQKESFMTGILDHPQYTRPAEFRGMMVPEVLLSGDHEKIKRWRESQALELTKKNRPDLLKKNGAVR